MRTLVVSLAAVLAISAPSMVAQDDSLPAFEVASVRLTEPTSGFSWRTTGSRVDIVAFQLQTVLREAFRVSDYQLVAPEWLNEVFVDVHATIPPNGTIQQVPEMLRRLLVERFGLVAHVESRLVDGYALKVGEGELTIREVEAIDDVDRPFAPETDATGRPRVDAVSETPEGRVRVMSIQGGTRHITSRTMYGRILTDSRGLVINAIRMTMAELAEILQFTLDRPVVDRTGLTGVYEFEIVLPRHDAIVMRLLRRQGFSDEQIVRPGGPNPFMSVEGLGLRLEREEAPMDVIVVDDIRRTPTEN